MNKSVLIIGASSDIGRELAYLYAQKSYDLVLVARDDQYLENLSKDIKIRYEVSCEAYQLDILDTAKHGDFMESIQDFPSITISLIGYLGDNDAAKTDWEEAQRILDTNYTGVVSILNRVAEKYLAKQSGHMVVFSSVAGDRGRQSNYFYGSAKAGLTAYLSGLRNSLQPAGIQVTTVKPGFMDTKMTEHLDLPAVLTASPQEVAKATHQAIKKKKNTVYINWKWKWIMLIIKMIPEEVFKRLKL